MVILVSGGLDDGAENIPLGQHLADQFTVVSYRRRGRGDSGDTQPYAVQREIVDFFGAAADATAASLPNARRATIEITGHVPDPAVLGPILSDFYTS